MVINNLRNEEAKRLLTGMTPFEYRKKHADSNRKKGLRL